MLFFAGIFIGLTFAVLLAFAKTVTSNANQLSDILRYNAASLSCSLVKFTSG